MIGHTDASGSADYNLRLSAQRAAAVVRDLENALGSSSRLVFEASGVGETQPVSEVAAENRRVEIRIERNMGGGAGVKDIGKTPR